MVNCRALGGGGGGGGCWESGGVGQAGAGSALWAGVWEVGGRQAGSVGSRWGKMWGGQLLVVWVEGRAVEPLAKLAGAWAAWAHAAPTGRGHCP